MNESDEGEALLRIWELKDDDNNGRITSYSWDLAHEARIEGKDVKNILGFDANNGMLYSYTATITFADITYWKLEDDLQKLGRFNSSTACAVSIDERGLQPAECLFVCFII